MKASLAVMTCLVLLGPLSAHAQGPSLSPIANVNMNAGTTLNVNVVAVDAENRPITLTAALPPFGTLNTPTVGTGVVVTSVTLTPTPDHIGDYSAAVMAEAGGVTNVRVFQITVNASGSDRAPIVTVSPLEEVTAGTPLTIQVDAADADGDAITSLTVLGLPSGASFVPNASKTSAQFDWTPDAGDVGEYDVQFTAANALSGTSGTHIRVTSAPTLSITPIDDVTVPGGGSASVPVHASGVPGSTIMLTASLPAFATLNPPGTGTGSINTTVTVSPPNGSAGTYHASINATSDGNTVTENFDIIVTGTGGGDNHAPVLTAPLTATVAIGSTLSFDVTATDADGDHVDMYLSAQPPGSSFLDHANLTGTFEWTPIAGQAGTYTASFSGLDNRGGSGSASTVITVTGDAGPVNHAPVLSAPATRQVDEGAHLSFTVTATDEDGDAIVISANGVPDGATFNDNHNNTATFEWTPGAAESGTFTVAFLGDDANGGTGTASTTIEVRNVDGDGGGDDENVIARACLIGNFMHNRDKNCFRLKAVNHSFDLNDVVLSSLRLRFHGDSIPALGAEIELDCHGHGHGNGHHTLGDVTDANGVLNNGHGHDDNDDDDNGHGYGDDDDDHGDDNGACVGVRCKGNQVHDPHGCWKKDNSCDTLGVRACFPTDDIVRLLLGDKKLNPGQTRKHVLCALVDAELVATLNSGAMVVGTFNDDKGHHGDDDDDDGDGHGWGKGRGVAGGDQGGWGVSQVGIMSAKASPNPLSRSNPKTELSFTTVRDGRLRVVVVDMQGRLVKRLLDEYRSAGSQTLAWDGADERSQRVASGVYFLWIQASEGSVTRRVTVVK